MIEKLAKIAAVTDIWQLEQEELIILAAIFRTLPETAQMLSEAFCAKVRAGKPRELEPLERAAIAIEAYDWSNVAHFYIDASVSEKGQAKVEVLASLLRNGG
jgi:hypothetical protein